MSKSKQSDDDQPSEKELLKSPAYQNVMAWFNEVREELKEIDADLQLLESRKYALVNTSLKLGTVLEHLRKELQK
jgi:uncharacterized membrane protein YfbV (UPF0208 family)